MYIHSVKASFLSVSLLAATAVMVSCGGNSENNPQEEWGTYDDPILLDQSFQRSFAALPVQGALTKIPWADTYWPSNRGGVAARWNTTNPQDFKYQLLSREDVKRLSADELSALSPAEKFDLLRSDYSYSLVRSEWSRTSPDRPSWEGLCHGWAPAAALFQEPNPVVVTNTEGVRIPFGSSDVKAILTYYQGNVSRAPTQFLGQRCNVKIDDYASARAKADDCKGVNPGAFHIVLANQMGLKDQSFMADVTRDFEVWNHPVSGFNSSIQSKSGISPTASPGTVRELLVNTKMYYIVEVDAQWKALRGLETSFTATKNYSYTLELNANGTIVGGEWLGEDRPDFLWNQQKPEFENGFEFLGYLYNASIAQ